MHNFYSLPVVKMRDEGGEGLGGGFLTQKQERKLGLGWEMDPWFSKVTFNGTANGRAAMSWEVDFHHCFVCFVLFFNCCFLPLFYSVSSACPAVSVE